MLNIKCQFLIPFALAIPTCLHAITIPVSVDGGYGSTIGDLRKNNGLTVNINHALELLKSNEIRGTDGGLKEDVKIVLHPGLYRISDVLKINSDQSGSDSHFVEISGLKGAGEVVLTGSEAVVGDHLSDEDKMQFPIKSRDFILKTPVDKLSRKINDANIKHGVAAKNNPIDLNLFCSGQALMRARWPNEGYATIENVHVESGTFTLKDKTVELWRNSYKPRAIGYWFYNWADNTVPVEFDMSTTPANLKASSGLSFGMKTGRPIFLENIKSELDSPGEWYYAGDQGAIYFWPKLECLDGKIEVSLINELLHIENAKNIRIDSMEFRNVNGDAVVLNNISNIVISNVRITNSGNRGVVIRGVNGGIENSYLENIGETGIELTGGSPSDLVPGNLFSRGNVISKFGQVSRSYSPGIALIGVGNSASGNRIYNSPHSAILFSGNDHTIINNDIYDVCKETDDSAAIYAGRDWAARGTKILKNYIHDISRKTKESDGNVIGVYLDDQYSGTTVDGNIFENMELGVAIGGGRNNEVINNKFINVEVAVALDARGIDWHAGRQDYLVNKLKLVPFRGEIYRSKYKNISDILEDQPSRPKYNVLHNNYYQGISRLKISKNALDGNLIEPLKRAGE